MGVFYGWNDETRVIGMEAVKLVGEGEEVSRVYGGQKDLQAAGHAWRPKMVKKPIKRERACTRRTRAYREAESGAKACAWNQA